MGRRPLLGGIRCRYLIVQDRPSLQPAKLQRGIIALRISLRSTDKVAQRGREAATFRFANLLLRHAPTLRGDVPDALGVDNPPLLEEYCVRDYLACAS